MRSAGAGLAEVHAVSVLARSWSARRNGPHERRDSPGSRQPRRDVTIPSAVVFNSRHALSIAVGAGVNLLRAKGIVDSR